jgi:hypothetical protein
VIFQGPLKGEDEAIQCKYLLIWAGDRGLDLYNSWALDADQQKVLQNYWDKYEEYVNPQANFLVSRHKLHRAQQGDRPFEEFLIDTRLVLGDCGYDATVRDEMLRHTIVFGLKEDKVRTRCMEKGNGLTLKQAIVYARTFEATRLKTKEIEVHTVHRKQGSHSGNNIERTVPVRIIALVQIRIIALVQIRIITLVQTKIIALVQTRIFDLETQIKTGNKTRVHSVVTTNIQWTNVLHVTSKNVHEMEQEHFSELFVGSVDKRNNREIVKDFLVVTKPFHRKFTKMEVRLDTGAQTNVLPLSVYKTLFPPSHKLQEPVAKLTAYMAYGWSDIPTKGSCTLYIRHKCKLFATRFDVTDTTGSVILGYETCTKLDLI